MFLWCVLYCSCGRRVIFCVVIVSFSGLAMRNSRDHGYHDFSDTLWWGSIPKVNNFGDRSHHFLRRRYFVPIRIEELHIVIFQCAELKGTTYPEMVLDGKDLSSFQKYVFLSAFSFLKQSSPLKFPVGIFFSLLTILTTIDGSEPGVHSWRCGSNSLNCKFNLHPQLFDTDDQFFQFALSDSVTRDVFEMVCCRFHFI